MFRNISSNRLFIGVFLFIFLFAVFLRLYHYTDAMFFMGDQGALLSIGNKIITEGFRPLVGPIVSANNLLIPPINYYLTAFFLLFSNNPAHIVFWYTAINILAMFLLYLVAKELMDKEAGLYVMLLFATSYSMILHGSIIWEPHPVVFFVSASLFTLHRAWTNKSFWYLIGSVIFYGLALGTYVSAYLLVPFYLVHLYDWFRNVQKQNVYNAIFLTIVVFGSMCELVFGSQYVLESRLGFPSLQSLQSSNFRIPSFLFFLRQFLYIIFLYVSDVFSLPYVQTFISQKNASYILVAVLTCTTIWVHRTKDTHSRKLAYVQHFLKFPWLIVGMGLLILYVNKAYSYRLNSFYPFVLIYVAAWARVVFASKSRLIRAFGIGVVGIYMLGNMLARYHGTSLLPNFDYSNAQKIVAYVQEDVRINQMAKGQFAVHAYSPKDQSDYDATQLWYLLSLSKLYKIDVHERGNDILRNWTDDGVRRSYLICNKYMTYAEAVQNCKNLYMSRNPPYKLSSQKVIAKELLLFVFDRTE